MLYIFFVGTGTMMTFDMNLAVETVATLQYAIEKTCSIHVDKQVLLISGGATLDPSVKVCNYGAGTDTNPIFLFTKFTGEDDFQSFGLCSDSDSDVNMKERVDAFENMAADYQTLAARSQLAREFAEMALHERMLCNQLVDSQHLQQQGWAAVIANLEDSTNAFKKHLELLENEAQQYFKSRASYQELLKNFNEAVDLLAKVPLLPSLVSQSYGSGDESCQPQHTLLTKYCSEPRIALEKMAEQCKRWIEQFNEDTLAALKSEVRKVLHTAEDPSMKEVKGIEERLFRLNQLMDGASRCAEEQCKYAEALSTHHSRVSSSNDMSVLIDLCRAHQIQLNDMLKNHMCLRDTRERCMKAKIELCENLQRRIKWVTYSQNQMFNLNNKLAIYRENLRRLKDHLDVIQQIHLAPTIYVKTLAEIRRRKNFSTNFLKWASSLSEQALELHKKEVNARKAFNSGRSQNFVNSLFPGMEDFPPPFATECPKPFDTLLPNVAQEDLENLKKQLPELAGLMFVPPVEPMPQVSHKSVVSDSAFSSEVPSSQCATGPSHSSASLQGVQMFRTETSSSLGAGEGVGNVQELPSPVSPFEDPFLPASSDVEVLPKHARPQPSKKPDDSGVECKRLHLTEGLAEREMFSPIEEEQNNVESDGDEFERVDSVPKFYDPCAACPDVCDTKELTKAKEATESAVPGSGHASDVQPNTDLPQVSPSDERLRTPDSMLTSHDFHSADYFIDDSMPSSYTESTGASALGRGHHMVKSHHVIVAELQHQLDEKASALVSAQGSDPKRRSNILKLHGTLSAFQRFVRDVQERLKTELQHLKEDVAQQRSGIAEEITDIMEKVKAAINIIHVQAELERVKSEQMSQQSEIASSMMLEHELELENLREEGKKRLQEKEEEISELKQAVSTKQTQIHMLGIEKERIEADLREKLLKEQEQWLEAMEEKYRRLQQSGKAEVERLQEKLATAESALEKRYQKELQLKIGEKERNLRDAFEREKEALLAEQRSHLQKAKDEDLKKLQESIQSFAGDSQSKEKELKELRIKLDEALRSQSSLQAALELEKAKTESEKTEFSSQFQKQAEEYNAQVEKLKEENRAITEIVSSHEAKVKELCEELQRVTESEKSLQVTLEQEKTSRSSEIAELTKQKQKQAEEYAAEIAKLKEDNQEILGSMASWENQVKELEEQLQHAMKSTENLQLTLEAEREDTKSKIADLVDQKHRQAAEYESEIEKLKAANESCIETIAVYERKITELQEQLEKSVQNDRPAMEAQIASMESQVAQLLLEKQMLKQEYDSELEKFKESHMGESQMALSETASKTDIVSEDAESLRNQVAVLEERQRHVDAVLSKVLEDYVCEAGVVSGPSQSEQPERAQLVTRIIEKIRQKLELPPSMLSTEMDVSSSKAAQLRIKELEKELQKERDKFSKLCSKFSRPSSHNKVSVLTCEPGDIVLFCYDEKHKNYIAFFFGRVPHFLHTDSLSLLNLKIPPESPRDSWALVLVINKEYCLAKKAVNRYHVPAGSCFFRVKVKPWLLESSARSVIQPQVTLPSVIQTQSVSVERSSEGAAGGEEGSESSHLSASTI